MKNSYKIVLAISLILNSYLIYKVVLVNSDNDILKSALGICENNNIYSVSVFENALLNKSKDDVLKVIIEAPQNKEFYSYKTKDSTEVLKRYNYKFEFKNDTLHAVYYNPR